jgi:hypothetical protein
MSCGAQQGGRKQKMRGGMMYGYGFDPLTGTGGAGYTAVNTSAPVNSATGQVMPDPYASDTQAGGRRRKKTKKGGKKSKKSKKKTRKTRKHRMRGGAPVYNAGATGTSFVGAVPNMPGSQTYGGYQGYNPQIPGGNPHPIGGDGVTRV